MIPALILVILAVIGNSIAVGKAAEEIVSETAHVTLILAAAQARNSFIDFIIV